MYFCKFLHLGLQLSSKGKISRRNINRSLHMCITSLNNRINKKVPSIIFCVGQDTDLVVCFGLRPQPIWNTEFKCLVKVDVKSF